MAPFIRLMCGYPGVWGVGRRPSLTRSPHHLPLLAGLQATAGALIGGLERAGGAQWFWHLVLVLHLKETHSVACRTGPGVWKDGGPGCVNCTCVLGDGAPAGSTPGTRGTRVGCGWGGKGRLGEVTGEGGGLGAACGSL